MNDERCPACSGRISHFGISHSDQQCMSCDLPWKLWATWRERSDEITRLRAEIAELKTPHWYWDDSGGVALAPGELSDHGDIGNVIEFRPVHELPAVWVLITEDGPEFFDSQEAAEAAKAKKV